MIHPARLTIQQHRLMRLVALGAAFVLLTGAASLVAAAKPPVIKGKWSGTAQVKKEKAKLTATVVTQNVGKWTGNVVIEKVKIPFTGSVSPLGKVNGTGTTKIEGVSLKVVLVGQLSKDKKKITGTFTLTVPKEKPISGIFTVTKVPKFRPQPWSPDDIDPYVFWSRLGISLSE